MVLRRNDGAENLDEVDDSWLDLDLLQFGEEPELPPLRLILSEAPAELPDTPPKGFERDIEDALNRAKPRLYAARPLGRAGSAALLREYEAFLGVLEVRRAARFVRHVCRRPLGRRIRAHPQAVRATSPRRRAKRRVSTGRYRR